MASPSDDYWTTEQHRDTPAQSTTARIQTLTDLAPLDAQFAIAAPKTVPDALAPALFGQPTPSPEQHAPTNLHCYAVLDAARIPALPELLEASELEHRCLFKGEAYADYKDVAPWLVRLEPQSKFTRNLFTRTEADLHVWDAEPGIFIRSHAPLKDLWRHLRKFTKLQDEAGKWFYFRFWEPRVCIAFTQALATGASEKLVWRRLVQAAPVHCVIALDTEAGAAHLFENPPDIAPDPRNAIPVLTREDRAIMVAMRIERFDREAMALFSAEFSEFAKLAPPEQTQWYHSMLSRSERDGIRLEPALLNYGRAELTIKRDLSEHPSTWDFIKDKNLHQKDRARLAFEHAKTYQKQRGA